MKSKKFIPFLFILILLLFNTLPAHAAQNKTQSSKKAYQQFLYKNREKNKYFQIVNIGNKNTPVLIIGKGTDRTNQSVFKKDKKIIKNLGYLNAEKYRKYRDSYKIVKSSIIFKQNTHSNRKSILKSNK